MRAVTGPGRQGRLVGSSVRADAAPGTLPRMAVRTGGTHVDRGHPGPGARGAATISAVSLEAEVPVPEGGADFVGRIFLDEVVAGDGDLGYVRPATHEVALAADEDGAGVGIDEKLRDG